MSTTVAVVIMVVVILVVGGVGYAVLSTLPSSQNQTARTCSPPTSPVCILPTGLNDVVLRARPWGVPNGGAGFGQAVVTTVQGQNVVANVTVTGGETVAQYETFWGDGSSYLGPNSNAAHAYSTLGSYVLSAEALDDQSNWHTGWGYLLPIDVLPNFQTTSPGFYPTLATTLTNGSTANTQFGWLEGSGTVNVSARYTSLPTASGYAAGTPSLISTDGTRSGYVQAATNVSASYSFSVAGIYYITMVGPITGPSGTIYQNYTWTVYVSPPGVPAGCGSCMCACGTEARSPHSGQIIFQEVAPGGATSEDPSVAYDTISAEPILNVYQTLVTYNGSSTSSFLPQLSLCVPGPDCQAKYGNTLLVNNGTSPQYWTFPIDKAARFYDPATGKSWSVYPSDVMFTMSRTCSFANLPGVGVQSGWIQCQALLPNGTAKWDSAIHQPYNNTPLNVLGSMLINDSTYCPASVMAVSNGCITFNAWGGGASWPFFLQLVTDPLGASVEPCGWFSAQSAGVPGFAGTTAASGDGPCYLPGPSGSHITSTTDTTYTTWLNGLSPKYWDDFQGLSLNTPGIQPNVRWNMVGSGPYYVTHQPFQQSVGYTLAQNPAYTAPTGCAAQPNCEPLAGPTQYAANVTVIYQSTDTVGIEQYKSGETDFATILPGETPQMLSLIQEGKIGAFMLPTLSIFFLPFSLMFDLTAARSVDPNNITVPGDFLSYVGLREFLVNAFPYNTVENTIFTTDGIQYGFNYGGAIPQYMGNYYPTNISWPSGDPVSNPAINGSAAWWWAQATTPSSPYYDPELASCTTSSPCQFPIVGQRGATTVDQLIQDYMPYISQISSGRLSPNTFDFSGCPINGCGPYGQVSPVYNLGWAPDYPDPTDYMAPLYYPNSTYATSGDALYQTLAPLTCGQGPTPASTHGLVYWADQSGVPQACQGSAYAAMVWGLNQAGGMAVGPARVLFYNLVEHIANHLALYVYYDQENLVTTYAAWINPTTINTNPTIGGGGDNTWYLINGNGVLSF